MYDAIIVGARVAGSPTAMLLARNGLRVLLVDRATFPSDTMSTHQIQLPGSVALKRWGLLHGVLGTGPGMAHHVRFDTGPVIVEGTFPTVDGVDAVCSPRRYLPDHLLLTAAARDGAEVREGFTVSELVWEDGRVVGVRGHSQDGQTVTEHARLVIGADGRHSLVARTVGAVHYAEQPTLTVATSHTGRMFLLAVAKSTRAAGA